MDQWLGSNLIKMTTTTNEAPKSTPKHSRFAWNIESQLIHIKQKSSTSGSGNTSGKKNWMIVRVRGPACLLEDCSLYVTRDYNPWNLNNTGTYTRPEWQYPLTHQCLWGKSYSNPRRQTTGHQWLLRMETLVFPMDKSPKKLSTLTL